MPKAVLARQAIINLNGKVLGYELLFRGDGGFENVINSNLLATSKVLLNILTHMDHKEVIGDNHKAFINLDHDVLFSGITTLLTPEHFVIELLETTEVTQKLVNLVKKMKKQGFVFAIDDFDCTAECLSRFKPVLPYVDYVKFDMKLIDDATAHRFMKAFQESGKKIIAEKIESAQEYRNYIAQGYNFFQGFACRKPEIMEIEVPAQTAKSTVLHIISLIKEDKEIDEIERYARTQPDLVHNLLKYLNSPTVGVKNHISSMKQAMNLLGRIKLTKWLLLYIFSDSAGNDLTATLLKTALDRAEGMEEMTKDKGQKDKAYMTGMLSLLDVLFNTPMQVILRGLPLEEEITTAITSRGGALGKMLTNVEKIERKRLKALVEENFSQLQTGDVITLLKKNGISVN